MRDYISFQPIYCPKYGVHYSNKFLRTALYLPALVAIQHEPNVKAYYEKLVTSGKSKMRAVVAVMRKLLLAIWGILNSGTKWQGEKFFKINA